MEVPYTCKDSTLRTNFVEYYASDIKLCRGEGMTAPKTPKANRHKWKIGRNEQCPCGSGKKFKKCHLAEVKGEVNEAK